MTQTAAELARWEADLTRREAALACREEALRQTAAAFEAERERIDDGILELEIALGKAELKDEATRKRLESTEKRRKNATGAAARLRRKLARNTVPDTSGS
jgi:chromosome segregation ATPase